MIEKKPLKKKVLATSRNGSGNGNGKGKPDESCSLPHSQFFVSSCLAQKGKIRNTNNLALIS